MTSDEEAKDEVKDLSDVETPRMDVTGLKLDAAQKEKTSFLQELKKQSFVLSEDSTQKVDVKDSVNVSAIQAKQNGMSSSKQPNPQSNNNSLGQFNVQQNADKMVKKANRNNMVGINQHAEDEVSEEEELSTIKKDEEQQKLSQANKAPISNKMTMGQSNFKGGLEVKKNASITSSNQAGQTDESLEDQDDLPKANPRPQDMLPLPIQAKDGERHYSADLNEGKRAQRQPTRFNKKMPSVSDEDEDEDEDEGSGKTESDEEKEEFKGGDKTGSKSEMSEDSDVHSDEEGSKAKSGSIHSGSNKRDEKQPLLAAAPSNEVPKSAQFGLLTDHSTPQPMIQDIRRDFD